MLEKALQLVLILLLFTTVRAFAQDKVERELKVKTSTVPKDARDWLEDAFETTKSPKWYKEINESGYSYEAKFKLDGQFFSVEFDSIGNIQDVEIEMSLEELSPEVQENLNTYFSTEYKNHKIRRLQIQYSGYAEDLEDLFDENEFENLEIRYEVEFTGTDLDGLSQFWEGLFDEKGKFIRKRRIITPPTENLIF